MEFQPDFQNIVDAANNVEPARLPLYEHIIATENMEVILNHEFAGLRGTDDREFFRWYCRFFREMGYDTVSFEHCITEILPSGGALYKHTEGAIKNREDFERYPWADLPRIYFEEFASVFGALREVMPAGMKAIGGVGNGVFETVQDIVGYTDLCYIREDDPELYAALFRRVGDVMYSIWDRFLREFGDIYCVCRFGDDLGFKTSTLIDPEDIRTHIIPQYRRVIDRVHAAGKPFLLHSCGAIFDVMEDIIAAGIDAKHSNEDQIALFPEWVERYGDRIGNFGGIDTDAVCRLPHPELKEYITNVLNKCKGHGGIAFGSGNSIPAYVPADNYCKMVEIVREWRGESGKG